jgi:two-component system, sensor histidine kinase and response regulator
MTGIRFLTSHRQEPAPVEDLPRQPADARAAYLAAAFDASPCGLLVVDDEGTCIDANRAACELLGADAATVVGARLEELAPAGLREQTADRWSAFLRDGSAAGEFEVVAADGLPLIVEWGADTSLVPGYHLWVLHDATERSRAQSAQRATGVRAVEASALKSQFMANMNQELRTPLNGVIGITRLLETTTLDPQQREYVQALRVSGDGLTTVADAIGDFAKLENGALELADEPYDLRTVIEEVCSVVALGASGSDVDVVSYVEAELPALLQGDEQHVRQALTHLVGNAVRVTSEGGVCVSASLSADADLPRVRIEVADSGPGIEADRLAWLLESPEQLDGRASPHQTGSGLGLTIARRLVALMGGGIGAESTPGDGSTFWLTLPLRAGSVGPPRAPEDALNDVRVLLVNANPTSGEMIERQLAGWNARVAAAADGDEALRILHTAARIGQPYALALIDHRDAPTPELDATSLVGTIRQEPDLHDTRLVMLAAPLAVPTVAAVAPDGLVTKPAGQSRLYAELVRVLAAGDADDTPAPPLEQAEDTGNRGRVLVAEDNAVNQLVAVALLEQRGFLVDVAGDGRKAIAMHAHHVYDAIFMDCHMPEINGYEATREIRRREGSKRHTPIIAMTASTLPEDRERCLAAGMDHHVVKPVRPSWLDHAIAKALTAKAS